MASAELLDIRSEFATDERLRPIAGMALDRSEVWLAADSIPDLRLARAEADIESSEVYEGYMGLVRQAVAEGVPLEADAISVADEVLATERRYGKNSHEYRQARQGLFVNNQRFIAEAWSKLGLEYFAPLRQTYDPEHDDYTFLGAAITPMIHRGITPLAEVEEVPRRMMENRENATNNRLGKLVMRLAGVELPDGAGDAPVPKVALPRQLRTGAVRVLTISECPDHVIERYQCDAEAGRKRSYSGYAPQIKKRMLRCTSFDPETGDRYVEQLSVGAEYGDHEVVLRYLEARGLVEEGVTPSKTDVLGLQIVTNAAGGVMDVAREIDTITGQLSGKNIYLGQEVSADHPKDYGSFPAEAAARQNRQHVYAEELTEYTLELAASGLDHTVASELVANRAQEQIIKVAKQDLGLAAVALDSDTTQKLKEAQAARLDGDHSRAIDLERQAEEMAPPVEACGAACEIKEVKSGTAEAAVVAKLTNAKAGDKLAIDESKGRRCPCGGQLAYSYNDEGYTTACIRCKKTKHKASKVK